MGAAAPAAGLFAWFAAQLPAVASGGVAREAWDWIPSLSVQLTLRLDAWALLFCLLITGIGAGVLLYGGRYLEGHPHLGRFYSLLWAFLASMLGLVLSDNLLALFVFWELTSITSYLLIGFEHRREGARASALMGLLVTVGGGQALLAGLLLLGMASGTWELSALIAARGQVVEHALYPAIVVLLLLGAFTKSAQVPFHFWLPGAMAAPTPVSAFLHSATMVKAGVYLLGRLNPSLGDTPLWTGALSVVGGATMVAAAFLALRETDLKRILAYATVSVLGTLTFLIGLGTPAALQAMAVFLLGHALYKAALFLAAGAVDHSAHTRDIRELGGLGRAMPLTAAATFVAAISMAGVAPAFGFVAKELVYEAALAPAPLQWLTAAAAAAAFVPTVAVAALVSAGVFAGRTARASHPPHEAPAQMLAAPLLLGAVALALGVYPAVMDSFLTQLSRALHPAAPEAHLALWHGVTPALTLSVGSLLAGLLIYIFRGRVLGLWRSVPMERVSAARAWERGLDALKWTAAAQTRWIQTGYLRRYVLLTVVATGCAVAFALFTRAEHLPSAIGAGVLAHEAIISGLILLAAFFAATSDSRLAAVTAMGVVGFGVALTFLFFGAPDLALTQAIVEALTVVVFALALLHLPRFEELSSRAVRLRDAAIALGFGALMTTLVLRAAQTPTTTDLSAYYLRQSVPEAHGRNVVNVILVDFRALDTLGEITVLAAAAAGVVALLRLRARGGPSGNEGGTR